MSKYTNYLIQAQDLNTTQAFIYNVLAELNFRGTSICWPTREHICQTTKIKKHRTISENINYLEEKGHVVRIGAIVKNNVTKTNMYWVNNGDNNILQDLEHMKNELRGAAGAGMMKEEMLATIKTYVDNYEGVVPSDGTGWCLETAPGSASKRHGVVPSNGLQNIYINNNRNLSELSATPNYFEELSPDEKLRIGSFKIKPNLHGLLAGIMLKTPECDPTGHDIRGNARYLANTLKKLDADMGALDVELILDRLVEDVEHHNKIKSQGGRSNFYTIQAWLEDLGWKSDKYRQTPAQKGTQGTHSTNTTYAHLEKTPEEREAEAAICRARIAKEEMERKQREKAHEQRMETSQPREGRVRRMFAGNSFEGTCDPVGA